MITSLPVAAQPGLRYRRRVLTPRQRPDRRSCEDIHALVGRFGDPARTRPPAARSRPLCLAHPRPSLWRHRVPASGAGGVLPQQHREIFPRKSGSFIAWAGLEIGRHPRRLRSCPRAPRQPADPAPSERAYREPGTVTAALHAGSGWTCTRLPAAPQLPAPAAGMRNTSPGLMAAGSVMLSRRRVPDNRDRCRAAML